MDAEYRETTSRAVPGHVLTFLPLMEKRPGAYYFAVALNAGQVSRTLVQLKELMAKDSLTLSAGLDITLPSNYIHNFLKTMDKNFQKTMNGTTTLR